MKSYLFVNPLSGSYNPHRVALIIKRLHEGGLQPAICEVRTPGDVDAYCRAMHDDAAMPLVIVAAGDGTINAVINKLPCGGATVAVLPLGTSNVLAAEIGIRSVEDGIERIIAGKTRSLPVGMLELEHVSHRFLLMAGIGIDGAIVRNVNPFAKRHLKQGAYALSALHCAMSWDHGMIEIRTQESSLACHSVVVCTASRYGGNFIMAPESNLFSGKFTLVCVRRPQRRGYIRLAMDLFTGRAGISRDLVRLEAAEVEIKGVKPIQIDGDFIGYSPATIKMMEDFTRIIV